MGWRHRGRRETPDGLVLAQLGVGVLHIILSYLRLPSIPAPSDCGSIPATGRPEA
jgi:hypothetical protein